MHVLRVIPIARNIAIEELSYYSSENVPLGTVVHIPLRKKIVPALVTHTTPLKDTKASLRTASYSLKKIDSIASASLFPEAFMKTVHDTAHFHVTTRGAVLEKLVSKHVLTTSFDDKNVRPKKKTQKNTTKTIQASPTIRYEYYTNKIREAAQNELSSIVLLPTKQSTQKLATYLSDKLDIPVVSFYSGLTAKKMATAWETCSTHTSPLVIVGTPMALSIPREDIGLVIVEEENTNTYKTHSRPHIDMRYAAIQYAHHAHSDLILGDTVLRTETQHTYPKLSSQSSRTYTYASPCQIIDTRPNPEASTNKFSPLSSELVERIEHTHKTGEQLFIYTTRRGLAPLSVCSDCGTSVLCEKCGTPLVLHNEKDRTYMCHGCSSTYDTHVKCINCTSWNITTLGVGSETIEDTITHAYPDITVFRIDSTNTPTPTKIKKVLKEWRETEGSILIGTQQALPYLEDVDHIAMASLDTLFAIPHFAITEKIFLLLTQLHLKAQKTFLIQTRNPEASVLKHVCSGNTTNFYEEEITKRKQFAYPPFSTFVKISLSGTSSTVEKTQKHIEEILIDETTYTLPITRGIPRTHTGITTILKKNTWPDTALIEKLRILPPHVAIEIHPSSLY